MTDLITFPDNNRKSDVYKGGNIHGLYCYIEMIGAPTASTTLCQNSHHFGPSSKPNNYTATLQPVIAALFFANAVEELDTKIMPALYADLISSHQVLEKI